MLRWLYIQLIWLHPAPFRWRFGDDMLDDFDRAALRSRPRYFADAVASLGRQWLLRPEFRHPEVMTSHASLSAAGVPLFQTIDAYRPRPVALFQGGLLAILSISAAVLFIGKAGGAGPSFPIGMHFSTPGRFPLDRNSMTGGGLNTERASPRVCGECRLIDMKATYLAVALNALLQAQPVPSSATPEFDVVSVKRCQAFAPRTGDSSPGRLSTGCVLLADVDHLGLIQRAYVRYAGGTVNPTRVLRIEGGPDWIHSEMFEIDARSDGHPSTLMMEGPMMQAVLEDRFKLKIHRETRQGPVYELALGKGSPKLKPFQEGKCALVVAGRPLPPLVGGQRYCRNMVSPRSLDMEGGTLGFAAGLLSLILDRPVVDTTGIAGPFEIHLVFSPEESPAMRPSAADGGTPSGPASDAPGIFQAAQEQLGLKLLPSKGPVEVLVIDHVERPSGN